MKRTWKAEVWMEEELDGWSEDLTPLEIEKYVSGAVICELKNMGGLDFVKCQAKIEEAKGK